MHLVKIYRKRKMQSSQNIFLSVTHKLSGFATRDLSCSGWPILAVANETGRDRVSSFSPPLHGTLRRERGILITGDMDPEAGAARAGPGKTGQDNLRRKKPSRLS